MRWHACARGAYADRIVLSHDAMCFVDWFPRTVMDASSTWRWTYISDEVLPVMRARGISEADIATMLVDNPRTHSRRRRLVLMHRREPGDPAPTGSRRPLATTFPDAVAWRNLADGASSPWATGIAAPTVSPGACSHWGSTAASVSGCSSATRSLWSGWSRISPSTRRARWRCPCWPGWARSSSPGFCRTRGRRVVSAARSSTRSGPRSAPWCPPDQAAACAGPTCSPPTMTIWSRRSAPTMWPTSCTPRGQPAGRRGSSCGTAGSRRPSACPRPGWASASCPPRPSPRPAGPCSSRVPCAAG